MAEPITCPRCSAILTDAEVITLHRRYASAQRKTRSGGRNGGRPKRTILDEALSESLGGAVKAVNCPDCGHTRIFRVNFGDDGCPKCALAEARRHSNAVLGVGPESERKLVPIEEL